jgi:hypothetical protein
MPSVPKLAPKPAKPKVPFLSSAPPLPLAEPKFDPTTIPGFEGPPENNANNNSINPYYNNPMTNTEFIELEVNALKTKGEALVKRKKSCIEPACKSLTKEIEAYQTEVERAIESYDLEGKGGYLATLLNLFKQLGIPPSRPYQERTLRVKGGRRKVKKTRKHAKKTKKHTRKH